MDMAGGYAALLIAASALSSWNVPFSSNGMRVLWKVVSVGSAFCPVVGFFIGSLVDSCYKGDLNSSVSNAEGGERVLAVTFWLLFLLHIVFRILLIVLIFLSFRNLPPGIYETRSWLAFLPSIH